MPRLERDGPGPDWCRANSRPIPLTIDALDCNRPLSWPGPGKKQRQNGTTATSVLTDSYFVPTPAGSALLPAQTRHFLRRLMVLNFCLALPPAKEKPGSLAAPWGAATDPGFQIEPNN